MGYSVTFQFVIAIYNDEDVVVGCYPMHLLFTLVIFKILSDNKICLFILKYVIFLDLHYLTVL